MGREMFSELFGLEWEGKTILLTFRLVHEIGNVRVLEIRKWFTPELEKLKYSALGIQNWKYSALEIQNQKRNIQLWEFGIRKET
ncbi:hypothetical protein C1645_821039 [Glomus cerebriforme]|uniref:Uncharacterized protein n=1 Tax=Glomus cerebriforme TaxID=658196 RepID=A0A397T1X1_9GLOM|nr:hypothetical protein C1645_821039 [Glomus cerebriforme]